MRFFKYAVTGLALIFTFSVTAQKYNKQTTEETMIKSYSVETDDDFINYTVKVETDIANWVKTKKAQRDQLNQTRVKQPKIITKTISVSSIDDPAFDNVMVLSYKAENDEDFRIYPNAKGFGIEASGNFFTYKLIDKEYYIDKASMDFFDVSFQDSE